MNILDEIIANKRREVSDLQKKVPIAQLTAAAAAQARPKPFSQTLRARATVAIIAEIKKASPSAGVIREDFDPEKIATIYESHGAAAISILTDEKYFQGKLDYLKSVREHVKLPLLRKDFVVDPYQVVEARASGADAILLILSVLSRSQFAELAAAAHECHLQWLVEVHTIKEMERALSDDVRFIGINNRDLATFATDLRTTKKLAEIVPPEVVLVSESGIKRRADIELLSCFGVDAVLIGETLMREQNIGVELEKLTGVPKCLR